MHWLWPFKKKKKILRLYIEPFLKNNYKLEHEMLKFLV